MWCSSEDASQMVGPRRVGSPGLRSLTIAVQLSECEVQF